MDPTHTVSAEVALDEFGRFCECMDLDVDESDMDAEDLATFRKARKKVLKAIMSGKMTVDSDGVPTYHYVAPSGNSVAIRFSEPTGKVLEQLDKVKKGHNMEGLYRFMSEMTGVDLKTFRDMPQRDLSPCTTLVMFFFD